MAQFKQTIPPVELVLKDSGISKSQIHEVVLVGGSTRIPNPLGKFNQMIISFTLCSTPAQKVIGKW